ncbi:hypothetical protein ACFXPS_15025 [Nocardia sp. NPDC059091]|uniref:hypothetical protein n=1 Tax=unclassified Nocardia TaxID=2637762 RepID=UPI0036A0D68F
MSFSEDVARRLPDVGGDLPLSAAPGPAGTPEDALCEELADYFWVDSDYVDRNPIAAVQQTMSSSSPAAFPAVHANGDALDPAVSPVAPRNDMDGMPDLTQPAVTPGGTFRY